MSTGDLIFLDCETTGLDEQVHEIWELAFIRRKPDDTAEECLFQFRPDMEKAGPEALKIGRFHERFIVPDGIEAAEINPFGKPSWTGRTPIALADICEYYLTGSTLVCAQPGFDTAFLKALLRADYRTPDWHYRTFCVESLTAGKLGWRPGGLKNCIAALNLPFDESVQHTALGDARACRDIWDTIFPVPDSSRGDQT